MDLPISSQSTKEPVNITRCNEVALAYRQSTATDAQSFTRKTTHQTDWPDRTIRCSCRQKCISTGHATYIDKLVKLVTRRVLVYSSTVNLVTKTAQRCCILLMGHYEEVCLNPNLSEVKVWLDDKIDGDDLDVIASSKHRLGKEMVLIFDESGLSILILSSQQPRD